MCKAVSGNLAVARKGDKVTCPRCIPSKGVITITSAKKTYTNNKLTATCQDKTSCGAKLSESSRTVYVENKKVHRKTNGNTCKGKTIQASPNVFSG